MTKSTPLEMDAKQFEALLDRIEQDKFTEADPPLIADLLRSMIGFSQALEDQNITIHRLKKILGFKIGTHTLSC